MTKLQAQSSGTWIQWRTQWMVLVLAVAIGGCAGAGGTVRGEGTPEDDPAADEEAIIIVHADYERFDVEPYREEDRGPSRLEHAVPDELMDGVTQVSGARTLDGYRIQLFETQDPSRAETLIDQATDWWYSQKQAGATANLFNRASAPVYNVWRQPYYRVRIGDFATQQEAEAALIEVQSRFTGAFVVPDRVTVPY